MKRIAPRAACAVMAAASFLSPPQAMSETVTYKYDPLGRVIAACYGTQNKHMAFSYDAAGNRTNAAVAASCLNVAPVAYNDGGGGPHQVYETVTINAVANDIDTDGDALTITSASCQSSGCSVTFSVSHLFVLGTSAGPKDVTYDIADGNGGTDQASANVIFTDDCPLC
ncbi:MAG: Ig-like domain-containing protein [Pseudomonadota bacterium]